MNVPSSPSSEKFEGENEAVAQVPVRDPETFTSMTPVDTLRHGLAGRAGNELAPTCSDWGESILHELPLYLIHVGAE